MRDTPSHIDESYIQLYGMVMWYFHEMTTINLEYDANLSALKKEILACLLLSPYSWHVLWMVDKVFSFIKEVNQVNLGLLAVPFLDHE